MMKKLTIKASQKGGSNITVSNEGGYLIIGKMIIRYKDEKGEAGKFW